MHVLAYLTSTRDVFFFFKLQLEDPYTQGGQPMKVEVLDCPAAEGRGFPCSCGFIHFAGWDWKGSNNNVRVFVCVALHAFVCVCVCVCVCVHCMCAYAFVCDASVRVHMYVTCASVALLHV